MISLTEKLHCSLFSDRLFFSLEETILSHCDHTAVHGCPLRFYPVKIALYSRAHGVFLFSCLRTCCCYTQKAFMQLGISFSLFLSLSVWLVYSPQPPRCVVAVVGAQKRRQIYPVCTSCCTCLLPSYSLLSLPELSSSRKKRKEGSLGISEKEKK